MRDLFGNCEKLKDVYCYADDFLTTETNAFYNTKVENCTLHVKQEYIDHYKSIFPWKNFKNVLALTNQELSIEDVESEKTEVARYTIGGQCANQYTEGLNIVTFNDGTVKKVIMK